MLVWIRNDERVSVAGTTALIDHRNAHPCSGILMVLASGRRAVWRISDNEAGRVVQLFHNRCKTILFFFTQLIACIKSMV